MKKVIVLISFLCGAFFVSAQQGNQQQRQQERWKPETAMITVVLNGIVVQNNYVLKGNTPYTGLPKYVAHGRMPLSLQDHGVEVAFRNIWIRDL